MLAILRAIANALLGIAANQVRTNALLRHNLQAHRRSNELLGEIASAMIEPPEDRRRVAWTVGTPEEE